MGAAKYDSPNQNSIARSSLEVDGRDRVRVVSQVPCRSRIMKFSRRLEDVCDGSCSKDSCLNVTLGGQNLNRKRATINSIV